jgi:hypothetical protein
MKSVSSAGMTPSIWLSCNSAIMVIIDEVSTTLRGSPAPIRANTGSSTLRIGAPAGSREIAKRQCCGPGKRMAGARNYAERLFGQFLVVEFQPTGELQRSRQQNIEFAFCKRRDQRIAGADLDRY